MDIWGPPSLHWDKDLLRGQQIRVLHPDHLGAVAALHGLKAAPGDRCRFLEIGCGDAWNILPMADGLPTSDFVGIDLDADRLARGEQVRSTTGLNNLSLRADDFLKLEASAGRFDYVVAHGVYGWAGEAVRAVFFERVADLLHEGGIATVGTSVYPGCRIYELGRELALFHAHESGASEGEPLLKQLRAVARYFAENMARPGLETTLAADQYQRLVGLPDYLLAFDQLGDAQPSYFEPLVRRAERAGLTFVADAGVPSGYYGRLPAGLRQGIAELTGDPIAREQYADFCALPTFRYFVFAKGGKPPAEPSVEHLRELFFLGNFRQTDASDPKRQGPTGFEFDAIKFTVEEPLVKAALLELGADFPHALPFDELEKRALARLGRDAIDSRFAPAVLGLVLAGSLFVRASPVRAATTVAERPRIFETARFQLNAFERATTALHTSVWVPTLLDREALRSCDGRRTFAEIVSELVHLVNNGAIPRTELGPASGSELTAAVSRRLEKALAHALRYGLLSPQT